VRSERLRGYGLVLLAATLWATIGLFYRYLEAQGLPRLTIAFYRAAVSAILLFAVLAWRDRRSLRIHRRDWVLFFAFGLFGVAAFYIVYVYAIALAGMGVAAILMYTAPAWVAVLGALFLGEPLTRVKGVALLLAIGGCALIGLPAVRGDPLDGVRAGWVGVLAGLGAGLAYGLYTIFSKVAVRRYSPWATLAYGLVIGALFMLPLQSPTALVGALSTPSTAAVVLGLGLIPTVAAGAAFNAGLQRVPASNASIVATLEPALATLLGWLFLGERMEPVQIVGGAFILVAVVILQRGETSNVKREASNVKRQASDVKRQRSGAEQDPDV
jgi:DME family drug/metabolite transporter